MNDTAHAVLFALLDLAKSDRAATVLRPGGVLVMEHADTQGAALLRTLGGSGLWHDPEDHRDLTARPRAIRARRADARGAAGPGAG